MDDDGDILSPEMNLAAETAASELEERRRHERQWAQELLDISTELLPWFQTLEKIKKLAVLVPVSTRLGRRVQLAAFPSGAVLEDGPSRYGYFLTCHRSLVHASTGHRIDYRLVHPNMVLGLIDVMFAAEEPWLSDIAEHLRAAWEAGTSAVQPGA